MKKLVLAIVFVMLMALFIAFNYLLWDRESREKELKTLEYTNASNNASINAQNREIKSMEDENSKLNTRILELENGQEQLRQSNNQIASEKEQLNKTLTHKIEMLNILKQNIDLKVFEAPVRKWAEAIDAGKYDDAYLLEYNKMSEQDKPINLADYTSNFKKSVKSIKIKSTKLDSQGINDGEIYLAVTLEVKLIENVDISTSRFIEGLNEKHFKIDYDIARGEFVITSVTDIP